MNNLSRCKRHSNHEGMTKPGLETRFATDGNIIEIKIIHTCFGHRGRPANHEFKDVIRARRRGHLRQSRSKQSYISSLLRVAHEMFNQTSSFLKHDCARRCLAVPDIEGSA